MRTLIIALGLILIPAVVMAAPSQPSCKFLVTTKSSLAFSKACTSTERRLLPHAVATAKARYTLKADLKSAADSAQHFYTRYCAKVVHSRKATSRNWLRCYNRLPSWNQQQQMMIPSVSLKTYVSEMCGKIRSNDKLANCAIKAATNEDGLVNGTILKAVEAYRTLKTQKATARKYIKAVTGGCKLGSFGKLKCAGIDSPWLLVALLLFVIGRRFPQARVACGIIGAVIGIAICVSDANAEPCVNQAHNLSSASEILTCELTFSSTESNRKYTLAALDKAYISVCSVAKDYIACDALYQEARKLFRERMGAIILREATVLADAHYGDGRVSACPLTKNICKAVSWKE